MYSLQDIYLRLGDFEGQCWQIFHTRSIWVLRIITIYPVYYIVTWSQFMLVDEPPLTRSLPSGYYTSSHGESPINGGFHGNIIYKWVILYGYVSHNQMVNPHQIPLNHHFPMVFLWFSPWFEAIFTPNILKFHPPGLAPASWAATGIDAGGKDVGIRTSVRRSSLRKDPRGQEPMDGTNGDLPSIFGPGFLKAKKWPKGRWIFLLIRFHNFCGIKMRQLSCSSGSFDVAMLPWWDHHIGPARNFSLSQAKVAMEASQLNGWKCDRKHRRQHFHGYIYICISINIYIYVN